jgi:hypothetical protein
MLYRDLMGTLDSARLFKVATLMLAANAGGDAVDEWIVKEMAEQRERGLLLTLAD